MAKDKPMPLEVGDRVRIKDGGTEIWTNRWEVVVTNLAGKFSVEQDAASVQWKNTSDLEVYG
jgi:hypothetical protein